MLAAPLDLTVYRRGGVALEGLVVVGDGVVAGLAGVVAGLAGVVAGLVGVVDGLVPPFGV